MQAKRYSVCPVVALAVALAALVAPAAAGAAIQIGATFPPGAGTCGTNATGLQSGSPGGSYAAPSTGVITSWSFQGADQVPTELKLKVARSAGGNSFTIVGQSAPESPTANALNTYTNVQIPVQPGDVIGYFAGPNGASSSCGRSAGSGSGFVFHGMPGDPPPGTTADFGPATINFQINFSALLEADCDSDGLGDETQDPSVLGGDCPPRSRALVLDANKNKVKKGKRVTLSGRVTELARQGECQSGQDVQLQRKRPKATTFTTVEQLQTDAAGNFATKRKVKKTFEYRAQVAETTTCGTGLSNTEKVKVKK
jgi:hypothetical protein